MPYQRILMVLLALFGITGCDVIEEESLTDRLIEVGDSAPEYGGVSLKQSGRLVLYVLDADAQPAAREVLVQVFGEREGRAIEIAVKDQAPAEAWPSWQARLTPAMTVEGAVSLGLHPSNSYIEIGVATAEALIAMEAFLESIDYPTEAVILRVRGYPQDE